MIKRDSDIAALLCGFTLFALGLPASTVAQDAPTNLPPKVSVLWPRQGERFGSGTLLKIKAEASDADGSVTQVRFFAQTNVIGVATNPPYNVLWDVGIRVDDPDHPTWTLKAVAVDNLGASNESIPVTISYYTGAPPGPVVEMVSPRNGTLFAAPATFDFSAEVLASLGDTGPVEYFVGTNLVGVFDQVTNFSATTPPSSVTVSNLAEGEYRLTVRYLGAAGSLCLPCLRNTNTIRVVKLGARMPSLTADGRIQFEVVTSFPGRPTIIETSFNLRDWTPISTNEPPGNTFTFTDSSPACDSHRFYRVLVPPE
jgi:hypothetical protein